MSCRKKNYKKKMRRLAAVIAFGFVGIGCFVQPAYCASEGQTQPSLVVRQYQLSGQNPLAGTVELKKSLEEGIGKSATLKELEQKAAEITRLLRSKGYFVATAYVPVQDFAGGKVEIAIEPGHYDEIIINNTTKIHEAAIRRELGAVKPGAMIEKAPLERAILLIGDMANAEAKTSLKAGAKPGTTTLTINVSPKGKKTWGYVGVDNGGYRYTGRYQYSVLVNEGNPLQQGDLLSASLLHTGKGQSGGSFSYTSPVWNQGSRIGISYSRSTYTLGDVFTSLGATGTADTLSLSYQKNFKRTRDVNWYGEVRFESKQLHDELKLFKDDSRKSAQNWVIGTHGDSIDTWLGGGTNTYSLTYTNGDLSLKDPVAQLVDSDALFGLHTAGRFSKYNLSLTRLQQIRDRVTLNLSYARQLASKNLDASEKMSLGGPYGVRAYPIGEASGDQGWIGSAELRYNLPTKEGAKHAWQLISFVDAGSVQLNKTPLFFNANQNHRSLYGMGIGVNWSQEDNWAARVHYAWKLGAEDAQSDKDRSGRLWVQLYRFF